jgi:preprotein translocase subunit YajC
MTFFRKILASALPAALFASAASAQPAAPAPQAGAQTGMVAGAKVSDTKGGEVGTITKVDGQFVVLRTDKHEARLPTSSFTPHQGGFVMAMTRDELNSEIEKTLASATAKLVAGASVSGSQGSPVGTIEKIEEGFVTLKLTSGTLVRLPRTGIGAGSNGAVIGMTAAELEAAANAAGAKPQ